MARHADVLTRMDHYRIWAEARDRDGAAGVFGIQVSERDAECSTQEEWKICLLLAAVRNGVVLLGPINIEAI